MLDDASRKSTTIARKLRDVEALPPADAEALLTGEPQELYEAELEASANDED